MGLQHRHHIATWCGAVHPESEVDLPANVSSPYPRRMVRQGTIAVVLMVAVTAVATSSLALAEDDLEGHTPPALETAVRISQGADLGRFLDLLMLAESGGRDNARNPRSTALGPFQFIESTFLEVTRRHFAAENATLPPQQLLQLRTNRGFARRAAEAFTRDNAAFLEASGVTPTYANLRLAFLVGPAGAVRVLKADPKTLVIAVLGAQVVQANPFMAGMSAADLARWSHRNLSGADLATARLATDPTGTGEAPKAKRAKPALLIRCNQALASCRRWVVLANQRLERRIIANAKPKNVRR